MDDLDKRYYNIREVSELVGLPQSALRFYEREVGALRPGRTETGRRVYRPRDIEKIRMLLYLTRERGMTLKAAKEELKRNPDGILKHSEAIQRLRAVRDKLMETLASLHELR